jgi:hypothetical protein
MTHVKIKIEHAVAEAELTGVLTSRMVGVPVRFEFGPIWDGLIKAAVFQGSGASITVMLFRTNEVELPYEVLMSAGSTLKIGVEGRDPGGALVIPSTLVEVGKILEGADPHGTEPGEPTEPVWGQIMEKVDALEALTEKMVDVEALETAIENHESDPDDHPQLRSAIQAVSDACMQNYSKCVRLVNGIGPDESGNVNVEVGASAAADSDLSTTSTNPIQNKAVAQRFDELVDAFSESIENHESDPDDHPQLRNAIKAVEQKFADLEVDLDRIEGAIPTDTYINTLIDAKLGVIENGTY